MRCGKIVCVGQNYRAHIKELKSEIPEEPVLFLKPSSALIGDGDIIIVPPHLGRVDYEVELAVVIGKKCKQVPATEALSYVGSAAVFNDVTARDVQSVARKAGLPWSLAKGMDTFAPMSATLPISKVKDLQDLHLELSLNGEVRQNGSTSMMIFPVEEIISYASRFMTLEAGDIIATGTPEGVGSIKDGDLIEAKIDGVGKLRNPVRVMP
jgi:2-keto-4-pentenoate hydratase/2-oxohepta-3-ene-1,7-dioic acid hydratase in catechol pathway